MRFQSTYVGPSEQGVPMPEGGRGSGLLRMRMTGLAVGASFETEYSKSACYRMAARLGIKVQCRPVIGGRIRVWRVE